jgi:hypothetical protein
MAKHHFHEKEKMIRILNVKEINVKTHFSRILVELCICTHFILFLMLNVYVTTNELLKLRYQFSSLAMYSKSFIYDASPMSE